MAQKKKTPTKNPRAATAPLTPLADRVLVRPLSPDERGVSTASGIIIPEAAQEKSSEGVVVAVGEGRREDGVLVPVSVSVGDRVLYGKYGHEEVKLGGVEYAIVSEANILAIVNSK